MLSMPRKPPSNTFDPSGVLAVDPPGEVQQQLGEHPDQELPVAVAVDPVDVPGRPGVHRRVDVAERPLVRRQLAVRVHRPLAAHQHQLLLGERRVDVGQRDRVEGEVPRGEPGVLPLVGHRDDVGQRQVLPVRVAPAGASAGRRRRRLGRVAVQPLLDVVAVELLAPQQPGVRAAGDVPVLGVELRGRSPWRRTRRPRAGGRPGRASKPAPNASASGGRLRQPQPDGDRLPRRDASNRYQNATLVPPRRVDRVRRAVDDVVVDAVLGVARGVHAAAEQRDRLVSLSQNSTSGEPSAAR